MWEKNILILLVMYWGWNDDLIVVNLDKEIFNLEKNNDICKDLIEKYIK